jgi:hypothetical protein
LCAPHAVPSYLQNIPENAGEDIGQELEPPENANVNLDELEAEYQKYIADGMFEEPVEEEIEAPLGFPAPDAAVNNLGSGCGLPTEETFLVADYVPSTVFSTREIFAQYRRDWETYRSEGEESFDEMRSRVKRENAELDIKNKKEGYERLAEARKRPNYQSPSSLKREAKAKKLAEGYGSRLTAGGIEQERQEYLKNLSPEVDDNIDNPWTIGIIKS